MKLRTLFLFGAGVVTGLMIAKKLSADDEAIVHGPQQTRSPNPMMRVFSDRTSAFSDLSLIHI